ncbi:hypothetical protein [Isoptericola sp. BMS4]|uniref:hypothetical protein n=1 Tax=Isoptericola sp. BMS4 TaxID=2527875 RepID=UPI00141E8310|nr:hypothetical protein [Isoptericola sp. BMS4]
MAVRRAKAYRDTLVLAALLWLITVAAPGLDPKALTFVFLVLALLDYVVRKVWSRPEEQAAAEAPVATE